MSKSTSAAPHLIDPLLHVSCSVCGSPAAPHLHYGAISCYSCRAFFRRGQPKQARCILGSNSCAITQQNRTSCKMCRYNRCLEVGMKPDKVDASLAKRREKDANTNSEGGETSSQGSGSKSCEDHKSKGNINKESDKCMQEPSSDAMTERDRLFYQAGLARGERREERSQRERGMFMAGGMNDPEYRDREELGMEWRGRQIDRHGRDGEVVAERYSVPLGLGETYERQRSRWPYPSYTNPYPYTFQHPYPPTYPQPYPPSYQYPHVNNSSFPIPRLPNLIKQEPSENINDLLSFHPNLIRPNPPGKTLDHEDKKTPGNVCNYDQKRRYSLVDQAMPRENCISLQGPESSLSSLSAATPPVDAISHEKERNMARSNQTSVIRRSSTKTSKDEVPENIPEDSEQLELTRKKDSTAFSCPDNLKYAENEENDGLAAVDQTNDNKFFTLPVISTPSIVNSIRSSILESNIFSQQPRALLYQLYNRSISEPLQSIAANVENHGNVIVGNEKDESNTTDFFGEFLNKIDTKEEDNCKDISVSSDCESGTAGNITEDQSSLDVVPLKKRQRMMEVPYSMGHALNRTFSAVAFTLEEEFKIIDYLVRIEKYQNLRFDFLFQNFPNYDKVNTAFITFTQLGRKIPFNKQMERHLFTLGLEFTKQNSKQIFNEMGMLSTNVRKEVLNSTYPAMYVVFFSILEGNTREKTWKEQHDKTLQITKENHARLKNLIKPLEHVRSISIKDQERFTSPWAVKFSDEEKFEKTVSIVGRLLRDDKNLQALYTMLVMLTPSSSSSRETKNDTELLKVQVRLCQLIYRYLAKESTFELDDPDKAAKSGTPAQKTESSASLMHLSEEFTNLSPDEKTRLLIGLIDDVHDCAEIMQFRSLALS